MDNDKLKDIPMEVVGTTVADQEDAVVLEGTPLDEAQAPTTDEAQETTPEEKPAKAAKPKRKRRSKEDDVKDGMALKKAIAEQAREDEREGSFNLSLKKILVGDMLSSSILRQNVGLMILIVVFVVIGITNRYTVQQNLLEQSKLEKELQDIKFRALSANSALTERTRKSRIMQQLHEQNDSTLHEPAHPAFLIEVPTK